MAKIYEHASFFLFIYVCGTSLLWILGFFETGLASNLRALFGVSFAIQVGAGVTIFFIDRLNAHRNEKSLKRRLVREAGSRSRDIGISAVEWMDREGWLGGENGLLKGADLREARLKEARLDGANLKRAKLNRAKLQKARLTGANLCGAVLKFAKLHNANLNDADLQNAKCHGAEMPDAKLRGASLEDADMSYACLENAGLQKACFKGADLHGAKLKGAFLWDADFFDANLEFSELQQAEYHKQASWEKAKLSFVDLRGVDFSDANMKEAELECADLQDADLSGTNLQGANLKGARLRGVRFRTHDGFKYAFSGDSPPAFEDLSDDQIARKTNLLGATLPDGMVFTEDMNFSYLYRFTDPYDDLFEPMLSALDRYCNRPQAPRKLRK